jgi:hypothetical protein
VLLDDAVKINTSRVAQAGVKLMSTGFDRWVAEADALLNPGFEPLQAQLLARRDRDRAVVFELRYLRWRLLIEVSKLGGSDTDAVVMAKLRTRFGGIRDAPFVQTVVGPGRDRKDLRSAMLLVRGELRRRDDVARELGHRAARGLRGHGTAHPPYDAPFRA